MTNAKQTTLIGLLWGSIERFSAQLVQFVVMIVMARLLSPHDYGVVGMLTIFIAISQTLVDSGFSQALIRKQNRTETDNSTVFYFNIVVGVLIYLILFLCAPLIAHFYKEPILIEVTRVLGIVVIANSLAVVQRALLSANIDFKTQAQATIGAAVLSGIVGITMAANNFGIWAIVWQQTSNACIVTLLLWILCKWHPQLEYSWHAFKELFSFGSKLMLAGIINTVYNNIYLLVIGKVFSAQDLGHYTRAHQFAEFPSSNITGIIQRVTYPTLCKIDNDRQLEYTYRKMLRLSAFFIFPLMIGLAAVANPFVELILTEKWLPTAPLLTIICFSMMWYPIHALNLNLLQVKGRSNLFLRLEIIKKLIGVTILIITIPLGLVWMCIGSIVSSIICLIVNTHYTGTLINVGFFVQLRDLIPILCISLAMGGIVYASLHLCSTPVWQLIIGITIGVVVYIIEARLFCTQEYRTIKNIITTYHHARYGK